MIERDSDDPHLRLIAECLEVADALRTEGRHADADELVVAANAIAEKAARADGAGNASRGSFHLRLTIDDNSREYGASAPLRRQVPTTSSDPAYIPSSPWSRASGAHVSSAPIQGSETQTSSTQAHASTDSARADRTEGDRHEHRPRPRFDLQGARRERVPEVKFDASQLHANEEASNAQPIGDPVARIDAPAASQDGSTTDDDSSASSGWPRPSASRPSLFRDR